MSGAVLIEPAILCVKIVRVQNQYLRGALVQDGLIQVQTGDRAIATRTVSLLMTAPTKHRVYRTNFIVVKIIVLLGSSPAKTNSIKKLECNTDFKFYLLCLFLREELKIIYMHKQQIQALEPIPVCNSKKRGNFG